MHACPSIYYCAYILHMIVHFQISILFSILLLLLTLSLQIFLSEFPRSIAPPTWNILFPSLVPVKPPSV